MHFFIETKNGQKYFIDHNVRKSDRLSRHINNLTLVDLKKTVNRMYYREEEEKNTQKLKRNIK